MNNDAQQSQSFAENMSVNVPDDLWQYVQSLAPETVAQMSQPQSVAVKQAMERQITGLLGGLTGEGVEVSITMNRQNLARLLSSTLMSGYFLRNAEQRFDIEKMLPFSDLENH